MELTREQLITAATADGNAYASMRGRITELRMKGQHRQADALQKDYKERLARWIKAIEANTHE